MSTGHSKMFKRPSYFKHGCYKFTPPPPESMARLMAALSPTHNIVTPPPPPSSTAIMFPNQYAWNRARSELTDEQRMDPAYLKSVNLLVGPDPEQKMYVKKKFVEDPYAWSGGLKLVIKVDGDGVRVNIDTKMMDIQKDYFDKQKRPPLRKYVEALQSFGFPNNVVNKVIDKHIWNKSHKKEIQEEFDRLWPPDKKKSTVVKKPLKAVIKH